MSILPVPYTVPFAPSGPSLQAGFAFIGLEFHLQRMDLFFDSISKDVQKDLCNYMYMIYIYIHIQVQFS